MGLVVLRGLWSERRGAEFDAELKTGCVEM
jgi:hypothetical protein